MVYLGVNLVSIPQKYVGLHLFFKDVEGGWPQSGTIQAESTEMSHKW